MAAHDSSSPRFSRRELMAGAAGSLGAAMVGSRMAEAAVPSAEPAPPPVASPWTDHQFEIYLAGRRGVKPARPVSVEQLEKAVRPGRDTDASAAT